jgi:glutathionylspermidine synthase
MKMPWQIVAPIPARQFAEMRRALIFECCKWDPQVEDVCTLSPLPLVLTSEAWSELVVLAEQLACETTQAESEILQKSRCGRELGLPWTFRRRLRQAGVAGSEAPHQRLIRFDFHFTTEGWRISEANSDVPGGFNEASGFTRLMARHYGGLAPRGDPTREIALAVRNAIGPGRTVALIHATAFTDDRQVMIYLGRQLEAAGLKAVLAGPDQLRWEGGRAFLATEWQPGPVDFIFRFFPTEWLPALPRRGAWWHLLGGSQTPVCNPAVAILSQSKRFPLVWDQLTTDLKTWRTLLPTTEDPRRANFPISQRVLKPVFGRVGDMIGIEGVNSEKEKRRIERAARHHPRHWVAQKRFGAVPLSSPGGDVYPCIGIYTLDARVIGAYGRVARRPLIDHLAQDAAVLIAEPVLPVFPKTKHESNRVLPTVVA